MGIRLAQPSLCPARGTQVLLWHWFSLMHPAGVEAQGASPHLGPAPPLSPALQLASEISGCLDFVHTIYSALGFTARFYLSTRPEGFLGDVNVWDQAEQVVSRVLAWGVCIWEDGGVV